MRRSLFHALCFLLLTTPRSLSAAGTELPPTVIECSGLAETISTDTETIATFHDQVVVTGNNLKLYCDNLKVVAIRKGDPTATIGQYGFFKSLVATGRVRIVQGDREATCGRAEVFPNEDRIVLSEEPVVRSFDDQYIATGPRLLLYRGQRRAVIEGTTEERARITLPAIKDLGFDAEAKPEATPAPAPQP
ncbi:MAG: LptA/OstA family protein [Cephaloticoccus sp.]|nr:LptA/OstA family protein [Cephaloticoccus sp.]MCF7760458.1 LptA/OstA family protein [Cephaloticoccus sp.]